jgi:hypothetical protein
MMVADPEADRTPKAGRLDLFRHAGIMLEAAAFVGRQQRVRTGRLQDFQSFSRDRGRSLRLPRAAARAVSFVGALPGHRR